MLKHIRTVHMEIKYVWKQIYKHNKYQFDFILFTNKYWVFESELLKRNIMAYEYFLFDHKIWYLFVSNYNIFIFKNVKFLRISEKHTFLIWKNYFIQSYILFRISVPNIRCSVKFFTVHRRSFNFVNNGSTLKKYVPGRSIFLKGAKI